jgi:aldose 1-epimerase
MGYPGNLLLNLSYTLTDQDELSVEFEATTDKATHVNICGHSFFNLAGEGNGDILNHEVLIKADRFTPVSDVLIPTGELRAVAGTPMDFTSFTRIGKRIDADFEQLTFGMGYDHNWVLNKDANELGLAAACYEPLSGRLLEVYTTQPGVQLYTGNWLDGSDKGKGGKVYNKRSALCLETQHFPDSPNKPSFPGTLLRPGGVYKEAFIYKFSVK